MSDVHIQTVYPIHHSSAEERAQVDQFMVAQVGQISEAMAGRVDNMFTHTLSGGGAWDGLSVEPLPDALGDMPKVEPTLSFQSDETKGLKHLVAVERDRADKLSHDVADAQRELNRLRMILVTLGVPVDLPRVVSGVRKLRL